MYICFGKTPIALYHSVCYNPGMERITYRLIRSDRRTIGLRIAPDGSVEVRAPLFCPRREIDAFVKNNIGWIDKQLARRKKALEAAASEGVLTDSEIKTLAKAMTLRLKERLPYFADRLGVSYYRVTVRSQKTKWGSCSKQGNLNFNVLLMLAPDEVFDYVLIHELCHRKHMDHSKDFWALVSTVDPDYKKHKKWLKDNGDMLMARLCPPEVAI